MCKSLKCRMLVLSIVICMFLIGVLTWLMVNSPNNPIMILLGVGIAICMFIPLDTIFAADRSILFDILQNQLMRFGTDEKPSVKFVKFLVDNANDILTFLLLSHKCEDDIICFKLYDIVETFYNVYKANEGVLDSETVGLVHKAVHIYRKYHLLRKECERLKQPIPKDLVDEYWSALRNIHDKLSKKLNEYRTENEKHLEKDYGLFEEHVLELTTQNDHNYTTTTA